MSTTDTDSNWKTALTDQEHLVSSFTTAQELGAFLKAERKKRNLRLKELAMDAGVSLAFMSQIESGRSQAPIHVVKTIAKLLDIPTDIIIEALASIEKAKITKQYFQC